MEKDVQSDRLRLCEAADGTVGVAGIPSAPAAVTGPVVEETTGDLGFRSAYDNIVSSMPCCTVGIGVWQTVSVQVVDEEEERLRQLEQEKILEQERTSEVWRPSWIVGTVLKWLDHRL